MLPSWDPQDEPIWGHIWGIPRWDPRKSPYSGYFQGWIARNEPFLRLILGVILGVRNTLILSGSVTRSVTGTLGPQALREQMH